MNRTIFTLQLSLILLLFNSWGANAQPAELKLVNEKATLSVIVDEGQLAEETFALNGEGMPSLLSDADFNLLVVWTGWRAPGKANNGDVEVSFNKEDFKVLSNVITSNDEGDRILLIRMEGVNSDLMLDISYLLEKGKNFFRKMIHVMDTTRENHFLRKITPISSKYSGITKIVKDGGFGQPVALEVPKGSAFIGLEYPASEQKAGEMKDHVKISAEQYIGEEIDAAGIRSDWTVVGLAPHPEVKLAFMEYLQDVRIAPVKPYTLYNSWYDLRSTEYPGVDPANHMNEENVMRIIRLIRENMIEKHDIRLDAFVLDDGWDIYESDWVLRKTEFPDGLKPIAEELEKTRTDLGIWFGPTGGYSFRMKRIDWMREHGYETIGQEKVYHSEMLCLGGDHYSELFNKRVTDMVANQGVKYFKWDGIQFSCSETDHGHAVGIYSRRDIIHSLARKCEAVRGIDQDVYLNITSGTWLSPWWLKYANQIWMDGGDYGWASVPSFSKRDAAITYRDQVLYEDFHKKDLWFPISNLMTHGIIKGNLQKLGGEAEPIDKFTDNALLYFARGVSMWELYISPDILNEEEWTAISESIRWAEDRFDILSSTFMIGGDPSERQPYGYVHFKGDRGIVVLRNPSFEPQEISFSLDHQYGLSPGADDLVLHQVYPFQWISPDLNQYGNEIIIPLEGYETAVFELYPIEDAEGPLIANVVYNVTADKNILEYHLFDTCGPVDLLNPGSVVSVNGSNEWSDLNPIALPAPAPEVLLSRDISYKQNKNSDLVLVNVNIDESIVDGTMGLLLEPGFNREVKEPEYKVTVDGKISDAELRRQDDQWAWITLPLGPGTHELAFSLSDIGAGNINIQAWYFGKQRKERVNLEVVTSQPAATKPMPPMPLQPGIMKVNVKIGDITIER